MCKAIKSKGKAIATKIARVSADEKRRVLEMRFERELLPATVAKILGRELSCISRLVAQTEEPNPVGCPMELTGAMVDKVVAELESMIDMAAANYEVTLPTLMKRCRLKVTERTCGANSLKPLRKVLLLT